MTTLFDRVYVSEDVPANTAFLIPDNAGELIGMASFLISLGYFVSAKEVLLALGRRSAKLYNIGE